MNKNLTELAELQLQKSAAWRDLHVECFGEILAPGPGSPFLAVLARYSEWCQRRGVWASGAELRRQLVKAGYEIQGESVSGVEVKAGQEAEDLGCGDLNVWQATQLLGIQAGLLRSLREFGGGPPFYSLRNGAVLYYQSGLRQWREKLLRRQGEAGWSRDLMLCLDAICCFTVIETQHANVTEERIERYIHPRLVSGRDDRVAEEDLLDAARAWYAQEIGLVPRGLRELVQVFLGALHCRRSRSSRDGKRRCEWHGVWLRSAETAAESEGAARLRAKSGLEITVSSLLASQ
jgi:hypothetical protein